MRRTLSNLRITVPTFIHLRATPVFAPFWQFLLSTTGIFSAFPRIGTERAFVYSYQSGRGGIRTHSPNGNGFTVRRSSPTLPPSQRDMRCHCHRKNFADPTLTLSSLTLSFQSVYCRELNRTQCYEKHFPRLPILRTCLDGASPF